jgi:YD repeat-containing protein
VANAIRNDARVLTIDEIRSLASLPDGWTSTGSLAFHAEARSGTKSLQIPSGGSLNLTLTGVTEGTYQLSFWIKRGSGTANVNLAGTATTAAPVSQGKQWQRITRTVTRSQNATLSLSIAAAGSGSVYIDDIRLAPAGAQVHAMTYDGQGRLSSQAGPNDIISYYNHDGYGRLVEVRDHEGLLVSTQAQREARK